MACPNHDWTQFRCPNCDNPLSIITADCVLQHEGHGYHVRLHPAEPDYKGRPQVSIEVEALDDDGHGLAYFDGDVTDDYPENVEDVVWICIHDLAAKCWPEHQRIERERAEVRLQREINRDASR